MRKRILAMLFVVTYILVGATVTAIAAPDKSIGLAIEFNSDDYSHGDTVEASVYLTDFDDEADAGLLLGTLETHLSYDGLTYIDCDNSGILDDNFGAFVDSANKNAVILLDSVSGIDLSGYAGENKYLLSTLTFTVDENVDRVSVSFRDENVNGAEDAGFESVVLGSFTEGSTVAEITWAVTYPEMKYEFIVADTALSIVSPATIENGVVTGNLELLTDTDFSESDAVLVVTISAGSSMKISAPAKIFALSEWTDGEKVLFTGLNDLKTYEIRYMIWKSMTSFSPITDIITETVSGQ